MNTERNLYRELNLAEPLDSSIPALDTQNIKRMVHNSIDSAPAERKIHVMKAKLKYTLAAAIAILVLATTAMATTGIMQWNASSASTPEFFTLPTAEEVAEYVDYEAVLLEQFENGYAFESGSIVYNELLDENDTPVKVFRSITFRYGKGGDTVVFTQMKQSEELHQNSTRIATVDDVNIYYHSYTNKTVPADYEMTEADKQAEASGDLVFSWGTDAVDIIQVQSVSWIEDGVQYQLLQLDGALTPAELAAMAEEVIQS